ncbi:MAG TPA: YihY/virulence factor BrkB family protein [Polyangiaceae bacterium]|nr:YihY/virulence factor BrkB family protein [Polyangiaceae bacterium]
MLWRVHGEFFADHMPMVAGSVAFFAMLAIFPGLIGVVSLYGLLADPADVARQLHELSAALPDAARALLAAQLNEIVKSSSSTLGVGLAMSLSITVLTASGGVHALITGINMAYDEKETRSYLRLRWLALKFTAGIMLFVVVAIATIAVLPHLLDEFGLGRATQRAVTLGRWPALGAAVATGLSVLYRHAPNRTPPRWRWVSWGAVLATLMWTLASLVFSAYSTNFGRFNRTYGALGGVIVLLLWIYFSVLAILIGAELNAELEHQTSVDSTVGPAKPMGERNAYVADTLGALPPEEAPRWLQRLRRIKRG